MPRAPSTVRDHWRRITRRFAAARLAFGHGTGSARDEAAWLVCSVLDIPFDDLNATLDRPVKKARAQRLEELAGRRIDSRAPLAYLLKEAWLDGYRFYVDERVIVPRSHIAELLGDGLAPWISSRESIGRVLDMCTGSGCLAVLAARAIPEARIDATDVSEDALAVARINRDAYDLGDRLRLIQSDVFTALHGERYDLILANPPYVDARSMRELPAEYRHEPALALAGGSDGLDIVRRILREAPEHLTERGILVVEIGGNQAALEAAYPQLPFTWLATHAGDEQVFLLDRSNLADPSLRS
ncbi:MAG: 50S ribosomal protein L3 N(5)-glutamine methyltransferase [Burkholderiales bacterium]